MGYRGAAIVTYRRRMSAKTPALLLLSGTDEIEFETSHDTQSGAMA
jgi:hypothetical protein